MLFIIKTNFRISILTNVTVIYLNCSNLIHSASRTVQYVQFKVQDSKTESLYWKYPGQYAK